MTLARLLRTHKETSLKKHFSGLFSHVYFGHPSKLGYSPVDFPHANRIINLPPLLNFCASETRLISGTPA